MEIDERRWTSGDFERCPPSFWTDLRSQDRLQLLLLVGALQQQRGGCRHGAVWRTVWLFLVFLHKGKWRICR